MGAGPIAQQQQISCAFRKTLRRHLGAAQTCGEASVFIDLLQMECVCSFSKKPHAKTIYLKYTIVVVLYLLTINLMPKIVKSIAESYQ